jgi:NAD-dependent deacetylase
MRPDIVFFGEEPKELDKIDKAIEQADIFISIGTSGNVYPASGYVQQAREAMAQCIEINLEQSLNHNMFNSGLYGKATRLVPNYVDYLKHEYIKELLYK